MTISPPTKYVRLTAARSYPTTLAAALHSLLGYRNIVWQLSKRAVIGRYRGSLLGLLWSFLNPLVMLGVYVFVFGFVFRLRWGVEIEDNFTFALVLFSGLVVHTLFVENLTRAPQLVVGNVNLVKRVVFPLETLPWATLLSSLFHALVSFAVLIVFRFVVYRSLPATAVLLPLVLLPLVPVTIGVSWFLASLGVYVRDLQHIMGIAATMLLFLSPVFYPISAVPPPFDVLIYLNPLTLIIEETRAILIAGEMMDFRWLAVYLGCSLLVAWFGFAWFQKTRKGFADVL
jgi:lipopolysaccharide transport system permease protein